MAKQLIRRNVRDVVAAFPSHVALDGAQFGIEGFIYVQPGAVGYWRCPAALGTTLAEVDHRICDIFNTRLPTDAEREAASIGSLCGWDVPGADPLNHE